MIIQHYSALDISHKIEEIRWNCCDEFHRFETVRSNFNLLKFPVVLIWTLKTSRTNAPRNRLFLIFINPPLIFLRLNKRYIFWNLRLPPIAYPAPHSACPLTCTALTKLWYVLPREVWKVYYFISIYQNIFYDHEGHYRSR